LIDEGVGILIRDTVCQAMVAIDNRLATERPSPNLRRESCPNLRPPGG
jgi:hypothetical protein